MHTLSSVVGPSPSAVVHYYAARHTDVALLHTAAGIGRIVFAMKPLRIYESFSSDALSDLQNTFQEHLSSLINAPEIGWVIQLSYDLAYHLENIGSHAQDDMRWPLVRATLYQRYAFYDLVTGKWSLYSLDDQDDLEQWAAELASISYNINEHIKISRSNVMIAPPSREAYETGVWRILKYIGSGDIYQANLTHRWQARTSDDPATIYGRLMRNNPAEFAAFLQWTDADHRRWAVVSASPELFLRRSGRYLETRPMKGTRPRGVNADDDEVQKNDLLTSEKDKAELAMIVDLLRNDLGRVSEFGSVKVTQPRTLEQHPTVWQTTATVESQLRGDLLDDWAALLGAIIPGGSITGAPKIRACQIIDELEPTRRGLYCGHIGMINPASGSAVLSIAIRTILMKRDMSNAKWDTYLSAGAGIVADSDPSAEYEETCVKAAALLRVISGQE